MTSTNSNVIKPVELDRSPAEVELVRRLKAGEDAAYEELVNTLTGRLLAVASRITRTQQDAEDVVQEGFLSAFKAIGGFDGRATLGTWLHRIVVNAALQRARKQVSRREAGFIDGAGDEQAGGGAPGVSIDSLLPSFDESGLHRAHPRAWVAVAEADVRGNAVTERGDDRIQQQEAVRGALAQLPEEFRTVVMLRDIEGMDSKAVAESLGISDSLVRQRLHRGRQGLMKLLEPLMAEGER